MIKVKIKTSQGEWETSFDENRLISDVMIAIINYFEYSLNGTYEIGNDNETYYESFDYTKTIKDSFITSGDTLIFSDLGGND